ncbi:MAG TPA: GAF domain-containing sensor histidine kinase [Spirochaetia bacterium]|nr:GAF domain-containing sensor histidine kinase [Spirochaetia bacterium]
MQKLLGDILVEKGYLTSKDLNRALLFQMRKIVGPSAGTTATETFLLDVARTKYNCRDEFYLGKILTELKLLPEVRIKEALEIQQTDKPETPTGKLDALRRITARMNGSYNLIDLLNQVLVFAAQLVEAEASSLIVHDHVNNSLVILIPTGSRADAVRELTIPRGKGLAGWVYENSLSVISNNVLNDRRFYSEIDATSGYTTRQILCVPLTVKDKRLGALEVINKIDPAARFTSSDRLLLELFSAQAAIAIENTRLTLALARMEEDAAMRGDGTSTGSRMAAQLCASFLHALQKTFIPLRGYADRLREVSRDERVLKYRTYIDSEMARLIHRSELTLRFLKGELPFAPQELDVGEVLRDLRSRTWVDCRLSGIAFEITAPGELPVRGDRELLLSGLECIFQNSRDAMPDGGVFAIEAARRQPAGVLLHIRDTGRGFKADPHQVFEPFFTLGKPNAAGLGLSIARWIIEAHGGTITAEKPTRPPGAQLTVRLP